jgi:solute carrier family 13 (sodium-dependent dicarboxylate transporter), member 2/3/5
MERGFARKMVLVSAAVLIGFGAYLIPFEGLSPAGSITLGIFVTAALLWMTEAIPLFTTAFLIVLAEVILLGLPGGPLGLEAGEFGIFLAPFFDPIIVLFLGGFVLGIAMSRYQLDLRTAGWILARVGIRPPWILAGFMGTTALLSMWLSNTATTVLMLAVLLPVLTCIRAENPFRKALILGIPFAANIGGIGTPIGTPPNAIAVGALARVGIRVDFLEWIVLALPVMLLLLAVTWAGLLLIFKSKDETLCLEVPQAMKLDAAAWTVIVVFAVTVALWLTAGLHGVPEGIVALLPIVVLFGSGVLDENSLSEIGWGVLFIIAGGISLGIAMRESGLTGWIVAQIDPGNLGFIGVAVLMGGMAALMTTFISNSATANLLIPIVIALTAVSPLPIAATVALAASLSMTLPVSTPPNAIAYGMGEIRVADMAKVGAAITIISLVVVILAGLAYWPLIGFR